jgi:hypothetical protein
MTRPSQRNLADEIVDYLRRGEDVAPHVLIGPVVWRDADPRYSSFVVATADQGQARFDSITSPDVEAERAEGAADYS